MKKIGILLFVIFSLSVFAGDFVVIKYKDGRVERLELKGKVSEIVSIEFSSSQSGKKQATVFSNKKTDVVNRVEKTQKVEREKNKTDGFEVFENQMKAQLKPTFDGMWKTNFGTLIIKTKGKKVIGMYKNGNGRIEGTLSDDGFTITGRWSEAPDYKAPKHAGKFIFKLSKTGASFKGLWGFGDEEPDSEWVGRKIK